jgi:hypothetical protein
MKQEEIDVMVVAEERRRAAALVGTMLARVLPEKQASFKARARSFSSTSAIVAGNAVWS